MYKTIHPPSFILHQPLFQRQRKKGKAAKPNEMTIYQLRISKRKDDLRGIRNLTDFPIPALDGIEVVGPAWSVFVFVLVLELVELVDDPEDEVEEGSRGAAIKISFWAPSINPYREL